MAQLSMLMNGWKELSSRSPLPSPDLCCTRAVANKPPQEVKASSKVAASLQGSFTCSAIASRGFREIYNGPCSRACRGVDSSEEEEVTGSSSQQMNSCINCNRSIDRCVEVMEDMNIVSESVTVR